MTDYDQWKTNDGFIETGWDADDVDEDFDDEEDTEEPEEEDEELDPDYI